jgi:hypothetical protein
MGRDDREVVRAGECGDRSPGSPLDRDFPTLPAFGELSLIKGREVFRDVCAVAVRGGRC